MFNNLIVFKTKIVKVRKKHQCFRCWCKIDKNSNARNTIIRYDDKLISLYICSVCNVEL